MKIQKQLHWKYAIKEDKREKKKKVLDYIQEKWTARLMTISRIYKIYLCSNFNFKKLNKCHSSEKVPPPESLVQEKTAGENRRGLKQFNVRKKQ